MKQKLRTRRALVEAAKDIAREGRSLTIAEVAEVAEVSAATAYRYFSSPDQLILEIAIGSAGDLVADLPDDPATRLATVIDRLCDAQFSDEAVWRALLVASQQRWFAQTRDGGDPMPVRGRTRLEITRAALEPLEGTLSPEGLRRATMAIMLVYGLDAMVTSFDACGMEPAEARSVMHWAAQTLLKAALDEAK